MFKTFPEFSKLTLADKDEYEAYVKDFPPLSDLAFVSLMTLWNALDTLRVAKLNGNLVISYWLPGDEGRSGLSLVGTNKVDESLCTLFDYLKDSGQDAKLINIPRFVADHIRYPEIFSFDFKSGDEDHVVSFKFHSSLQELPFYKRSRIKKFVRNSGRLELRSLDLGIERNKKRLLDCAARWPKRGLNSIAKLEQDALRPCVQHATELGIRNLCLFEDGELIAYNLYHTFPQSKYILIAHSRLDYSIPYIFDYMTYGFSKWWLDSGVEFANIHNDVGILRLRVLKVALRPVEIFRKYTIRPAEWSKYVQNLPSIF